MLIGAFTNWGRLARALDFYSSKGFLRVETAWSAPREICAMTCPDEGRMFPFDDEILVGSAEQAFIHCMTLGTLPPGRYVTLTPCFRREPEVSETHLRHFMKVELFASHDSDPATALEFASLASAFMQGETKHSVTRVGTADGYDLEVAGLEVGSYSARSMDGMSWTCGTGLAEPRFSTALENADAGLLPLRSVA